MKYITFNADDELIERARIKAKGELTSLNAKFREWLEQYVKNLRSPQDLESYWKRYSGIDLDGGSQYTREERNER